MKVSLRVLVGIAALGMLPETGVAQTIQERVSDLEKKVEEQGRGLAAALGIEVHGLVAGDYLYNFNDPDSHNNQARVFDEDANSFTLNQANLWVGRQKEDESFGFATSLDFGKTADVVGRSTRWSNSFDDCVSGGGATPCGASESTNSFELREAYLTYKVPFGGISLKAGKFVTLAGAEVIKNYNNLNYTISNSILFGYAIPFTHTGLMASAPLGDYVAVDLGVVNGWDAVVDNNDGKSLHAGVKVTPVESFSMYFSGTVGPEQPDNGKSKRELATALFTWNATDQLTLIVDGNYAHENSVATLSGDDGAAWYGVAGYAIYKVDDRLGLSLRGEIFDDPDGVRGIDATVWEFTPCVSYQLTDGLLARLEYRHDQASKKIFNEGDHSGHGQDTVATELVYAF